MAAAAATASATMAGRVCAITGASSGLGYETALALAGEGATVALLCRSTERGERARAQIATATGNEDLHVVACDHANLDTVRAAAAELLGRFGALHVLVNNAGLMLMQRRITVDGHEETFQVNHLGAFLLTALLRERLEASAPARVITVSSIAHRAARLQFGDLQSERLYEGFSVYARSKLANVLFTYELQRRLADRHAAVAVAAHPGASNTELSRNLPSVLKPLVAAFSPLLGQSAAMGALPTLRAATDPGALGGQYFGPDGFAEQRGYPKVVASSEKSHDLALQRRLWTVSEELTGVTFPV
jgi:NAD(P)-dependent dehydrogenase (short-subunit alcohol dehydrogenase family)